MIGIIKKTVIVASSWLSILFVSVMHGQANIKFTMKISFLKLLKNSYFKTMGFAKIFQVIRGYVPCIRVSILHSNFISNRLFSPKRK